MAAEPVVAVLGSDYKKPFMLLVAVLTTVIGVMFGLSKAETFVDGRVELKIASQRQVTDEHEKRLTKIEEKLGSMGDVLADIRADVKVMRVQLEAREPRRGSK